MKRPTIVVIDDETGPRESLRMILKDTYQVSLAKGALEGLKLVEENRPDVVFLDIKMPEMEGTEVLRRIKALDPNIEVAMITAYAAVESAQHALRHGAIDYLTKPFGVNEVMAVVARALQRRRERVEEQILLDQLQQATRVLSEQLRDLQQRPESSDQTTIYEGLASAHVSIESQLNKVGQLTAIGEIAAEVAHDVDNFLSAILLRIEILLMNLHRSQNIDVQSVEDALQDVIQATHDSTHAVERISSLTKSDPYGLSESVQINDVLKDAVKLSVGHSPAGNAVQIVWETQEIPEITGNASALRTVFMNVVINARQAIADDGEIRLRTYLEDNSIVVEVSDTGEGMPPPVLKRVTEPFFTTKGASGQGLGLSIARKVIASHSGSMAFDSQPGHGTTVTIRFPLDHQESSASAGVGSIPDVLVVEDDDRQLSLIETLLSASGFQADTVNSGPEGLSRFEEYLKKYNRAPRVVITDWRMPGLMGTALARLIKEMAPQTRVILLSGYVPDEAELDASPHLDAVIKKPFDLSDLLDQVKAASPEGSLTDA